MTLAGEGKVRMGGSMNLRFVPDMTDREVQFARRAEAISREAIKQSRLDVHGWVEPIHDITADEWEERGWRAFADCAGLNDDLAPPALRKAEVFDVRSLHELGKRGRPRLWFRLKEEYADDHEACGKNADVGSGQSGLEPAASAQLAPELGCGDERTRD